MPQNEAELQLYRVMQRASLLSYYDTLLEMGGDDVQQLCDAGEEEFLEIMALVGMASKPLHVRRLQKALQEWLTNPAMFQTPVLAPSSGGTSSVASANKPTMQSVAPASVAFPCIGSYSPNSRQQLQLSSMPTATVPASTSVSSQNTPVKLHSSSSLSLLRGAVLPVTVATAATPPTIGSHNTNSILQPTTQLLSSCSATTVSDASICCPIQRRKSLSPPASSIPFAAMQIHAIPSTQSADVLPSVGNYESSSCGSQGTTPSPNSASLTTPQSPTMGIQTTPILLESQVQRLAEAAERLATTLRPLNPKPQSGMKKKICKNLEMVMAIPDGDPRRMEEIRKYAAIYGRFDCKRKPEKPLTLHEVSVNEAAAQICRFVPALLTRRDELFPLARRVVRDSGHYYTKTPLHSSCNASPRTMSSRENGDGELSGGDENSMGTGTTTITSLDATKRRKLDLRYEDEPAVASNRDNPVESSQQQAETTQAKCTNNSGAIITDSYGNSIQVHQNRHRKRQRRRQSSKIRDKSKSSPVWQSCSESSNAIFDGVTVGLEDSDGCYSSFDDDDWNNCNDDNCNDNFRLDSDDGVDDDGDGDTSVSPAIMHDIQNRIIVEQDNASCMMDKENDFNLKVIASCGDNIIAVANPALMNRNQSTAITKEQPMKEEITLRDRRD